MVEKGVTEPENIYLALSFFSLDDRPRGRNFVQIFYQAQSPHEV